MSKGKKLLVRLIDTLNGAALDESKKLKEMRKTYERRQEGVLAYLRLAVPDVRFSVDSVARMHTTSLNGGC